MSLHPPSTLLMGPAGTGKTSSLVTLLAEGIAVRMLATEPSAPNRVLEIAKQRGVDASRFDWRFVSPSVPAWGSLLESADIVNRMSLKDIADLRTGIARQDGRQWIEFLKSCQSFVSDRTGEVLGDVTEWGADTAFVVDGLTGLSTMSRNLCVGLKPNPSPGEWGMMQATVQNLVRKLAGDCKCFFVLIAHVERETNELTGISQITVSTLGAKLAPKLPPEFTNVIYAKREADRFFWSTAERGVDTKNGDLPLSDNLQPSFKVIVDQFRARLKAEAAPAPAPSAEPAKPAAA